VKLIVPRRSLIAAPIAVAAFAAGLAHGQATGSKAAIVDFEADLGHARTAAPAPFKAGGASWSCSTTHCRGKGPGNDPAATCAALVKQVGTLKTFIAAGRSVDVKGCNGVSPAMSATTVAPVAKPMVVAPTTAVAAQAMKPAPSAASKNSAPAAPPAAAPAPPKKGAAGAAGAAGASGAGISITAAAITLTGTGVAYSRPEFTPMAWTATTLTLTGTGSAAPTVPYAGIKIIADTMRLTGAP